MIFLWKIFQDSYTYTNIDVVSDIVLVLRNCALRYLSAPILVLSELWELGGSPFRETESEENSIHRPWAGRRNTEECDNGTGDHGSPRSATLNCKHQSSYHSVPCSPSSMHRVQMCVMYWDNVGG